MRRAFWTVWATVFALVFLLILSTHFDALFAYYGIPFAWLVLTAVGCVACLNAARRPPARTSRRA